MFDCRCGKLCDNYQDGRGLFFDSISNYITAIQRRWIHPKPAHSPTTIQISALSLFNDIQKLSQQAKSCQTADSGGIMGITKAYQENFFNF